MRVNEIAARHLLLASNGALGISNTTTTYQFSRHFDDEAFEEDW